MLSASGIALAASVLLSASAHEAGARPTVQQAEPGDGSDVTDVVVDAFAVGDVVGAEPSVSGDGRYVVFHGAPRPDPQPPVEGEPPVDGRMSTVFVTDRESGATTELTTVPDGLRSGDSVHAVISGDGCNVVVVTQMALDVFLDDDTGERWDVYRTTLPHCGGLLGDWELVSTRTGSGGLARDDVAVAPPTVSRSGALVAYTHPADHLYEPGAMTTISLVDLAVPASDPSRSRIVAGMPSDSPDNVYIHRGLDQPALSADGRHLAYRSDATSSEAVPGWAVGPVEGGPATAQVYVWDVAEADPFTAVRLVSAAPDGLPAPGGANEPDITRDGTGVVFTSPDTTLVAGSYPPCAADCPSQVYLLDRDSDGDGLVAEGDVASMSLVSAVADTEPPVAGNIGSSQPSISADGNLIAFVTKATNLQLIRSPGSGTGDDGEILVAQVGKGALNRLTTGVDGVVPTAGVHAHPDLDDTGRTTVFDTSAASELLVDGIVGGRQVVAKTSLPALQLAGVDLGTTLVGLESDEWYVAVINDGPATFQPAEVTIDNPQFSINVESRDNTCLLGAAVPAGGTCTVALSYTPTAFGPARATLTVAEAGFQAVSISAGVAGAGGEPALRIAPAGLEFGTVTVGEASTEFQVDVSNISVLATTLGTFEISGTHAADFEMTSNNCAFRPVNPRAACSIGITFTPSDAGRRTALLELATVSGQYTTALIYGDGIYSPLVELDVSSVEAGTDFVATGRQYPANTEVTIVFGDGPNSTVTATTDENGDFTVSVPVRDNERGGNRTIVVQTTTGAAASAPVEVIETDQQLVGMPGFGLG